MKLLAPKTKNIFNSRCQVLVCPVNTVGAMGNGLARAYRDKFPGLYEVYQQRAHSRYITTLGLNISNFVNVGNGQHVLLFPTKAHFMDDSKIDYIEAAMRTLEPAMAMLGLKSVAFPKVGCGKGNLDWATEVKPCLIEYLKATSLEVELYE